MPAETTVRALVAQAEELEQPAITTGSVEEIAWLPSDRQ